MDPAVRGLGAGEAVKHQMGGKVDLTYTGAVWSGPVLLEVEQRWPWRRSIRYKERSHPKL